MRKNFQASSKEKSSVPGQICILTWLTTSEIEWNWLKKIERCWHFQFSFLSSVKNGLQSSPRWNCLEILSISIFLFLSSWLRRFSKKICTWNPFDVLNYFMSQNLWNFDIKITEKVSFNFISEACYIYILSGKSLLKMPKMVNFWRVFEILCYSVTRQVNFNRTKINGKCQK